MSSTAIGLGVLAERNLAATSGPGVLSVMLLLQDVAAIPILAFVPLLAGAGQRENASWGARPGRRGDRRHRAGRPPAAAPALRWIAKQPRPKSSPPPRCCWWWPLPR